MYERVTKQEDSAAIEKLPQDILGEFYLAGGTGLAMHIGHRYSDDFDFFSFTEFDVEQLHGSIPGRSRRMIIHCGEEVVL